MAHGGGRGLPRDDGEGARGQARDEGQGVGALAARIGPWLALAAATAYFQGLTVWHRLLDIDEANYAAIAGLMNAGGRLYAEGGVDNKPPVIFWVYAAVFKVFGLYNLTAVHVLKVAVVLATAAIVALIARRLYGRPAAWVAAVLYVVFTAAGYPKLAAANTEVLMMLPLCASVLLLLNRRWFAAGALLALAGFTKQVAVLQLALFPLAALVVTRDWRPVWSGASGFAAGVALLLAVVAATGSLGGWWHWTIASVLTSYGPSAWSGGQLTSSIEAGLVPWLEAAVGLLLATLAGLRRAHPLVAGWLAAAVLGSLAGGHFFGHYFIEVVGPAAVLAAGFLADWSWAARRPAAAALAVGVAALPAVLFTAGDFAVDVVPPSPVEAYISSHSAPGDRILVWGDSPDVYLYSGRLPASRFPGFLRGFPRGSGAPPLNWDTTPDVWPALAADLAAHPAALVVDLSPANWNSFAPYPMSRFPVLARIVASRYEMVAVVDGVAIYRLR